MSIAFAALLQLASFKGIGIEFDPSFYTSPVLPKAPDSACVFGTFGPGGRFATLEIYAPSGRLLHSAGQPESAVDLSTTLAASSANTAWATCVTPDRPPAHGSGRWEFHARCVGPCANETEASLVMTFGKDPLGRSCHTHPACRHLDGAAAV